MDVDAYASFLAVFDTGTATAAAGARFISQPALSRQIQLLESRCKTSLFTRSRTGMQPTNAARHIEPIIRRLLDEVQATERAISALSTDSAPLTIACPIMVAESLMLPFVAETQTRIANVIEVSTSELYGTLSRREADVVIAPLTPPPEVESTLAYRIPFTLQVPLGSELSSMTSIEVTELPGLPTIIPDRTSGTRMEFDRQTSQLGVRCGHIMEVTRAHIGQAMAASGQGFVITVDPPKYDLHSIRIVSDGVPLALDEWFAWPPGHFAESAIQEFTQAFLRWEKNQPGFPGVSVA